jgi:ribosome biogenesis GTPase A
VEEIVGEVLCNLLLVLNIIRMIKAKIIRWESYVAHMGEKAFDGKSRRKETTRKTKT